MGRRGENWGREALFIGVTVVTPHIQLCPSLHGKLSLCGSVRKLTYIHTQTHRVFSEAEKTTPINTPYNTCEIFQEHRLPPPLVTPTQVSPSSANTHAHTVRSTRIWTVEHFQLFWIFNSAKGYKNYENYSNFSVGFGVAKSLRGCGQCNSSVLDQSRQTVILNIRVKAITQFSRDQLQKTESVDPTCKFCSEKSTKRSTTPTTHLSVPQLD